jgi:hypothetical protein
MTQTTVNRRLGFFCACCRGLLGGKAPLGAITVLSWWWWWWWWLDNCCHSCRCRVGNVLRIVRNAMGRM